jgi:hypothetical protein
MRPLARVPTKATVNMDPAIPTTVIPELKAIERTPFAYQTLLEAITAAGAVQNKKLNPRAVRTCDTGLSSPRLFLSGVMHHAYDRVGATAGGMDP